MLTKRLAYEKWLGIKEGEQPPTLYRLLALNIFETDNEIISTRRTAVLASYGSSRLERTRQLPRKFSTNWHEHRSSC